jgi:hypothetical protein
MKAKNLQTASLDVKITAKRAGRLETVPPSARGHLIAAWTGNCSPRRAIKANCLECVGFDRDAIRDCTAFACPLWNFRPFANPKIL